jgi:hypothetical protein
MTYEAAEWLGRILPIVCLVGVGIFVYVAAKRRAPTSYPPGRGIRFFDREGNEVTGRRRIVLTSLMVFVLICLLFATVLPWL